MSAREFDEPVCTESNGSAILQVIQPKEKDLGGFSVRRVLPASAHRRVGPFIFFDHMGPSTFEPGNGVNVRPHPHIGLSTLTFLFEGAMLHRDSLGFEQEIEPGAVNWMTAGRGIVHSERTPKRALESGYTLHGIQSWIALPDGKEEIDPSFTHIPVHDIPAFEENGVSMTLIAGEAFGRASPVTTHSPLFYLHAVANAGDSIPLPGEYEDRAIYVVEGGLRIDGVDFDAHNMVVLEPGSEPAIEATTASRVMLLGGAPLESDRIVWWNFSSSSKARIEQAKADWREGKFDEIENDSEEFIPLPE